MITTTPSNFADLIALQARLNPERVALICPDYRQLNQLHISDTLTYRQLLLRIQTVAQGLQKEGLQKGDLVPVFAPISANLFVVVLGLMAIGAIPVLMNPGLGLVKMYRCFRLLSPQAIIGSPEIIKYRWLVPVLRQIPLAFTLPKQPTPGVLAGFSEPAELENPVNFKPLAVPPEHTALITFTSGSSGQPKGVNRTHGILSYQYLALKAEFPPLPQQVDMPGFPVLTLYNLCCGITTVLPLVNFRSVDQAEPAVLLGQINKHQFTTLSGAPAYLRKLINYCKLNSISLPQIKGVATGGAPIEPQLCRELKELFPEATVHIAYGSSEAEPVAATIADEVLAYDLPLWPGYFAGKPASHVQLRILPLANLALAAGGLVNWHQIQSPDFTTGEVVVTGTHVCKNYLNNPSADQANKLIDETGTIWHRMGDIGFLDDRGMLWLTGRKENLLQINGKQTGSYPIELFLNQQPGIRRAAAVGDKESKVHIFAETRLPKSELKVLLKPLLNTHFQLSDFSISILPKLPLDTRHQSKIDTPQLRALLNRPWWKKWR